MMTRSRKNEKPIRFRYYKNLLSPDCEEYLTESDDEEHFKTSPKALNG